MPFTLVGGYLGAGKTTLVNQLIRHNAGRRLVVLVNDAGAVNVDAELIAEHAGDTLSLTNGCVCCSIGDDLGQALERIRTMSPPPDHVLMELSGVAEPARVSPWANTTGFQLDGIVVVADAEQVADQIADPYVGQSVCAQLMSADVIVLAKTDLVSDGGAAARRQITDLTETPVVDAADFRGDPSIVLGSVRLDVAGARPSRQGDPTHHIPAEFVSSTIDVGRTSLAELEELIASIDAIRAKGLIRCHDVEHPVEVHVVGSRRSVRIRHDLPADRAGETLVLIHLPASL